MALWDISFDDSIPIEEPVADFEVRSATILGEDGVAQVLREAEWAAKNQLLGELWRRRDVR